MAMAQVLQFPGGTLDQYNAIRDELGWRGGEDGKPEGLLGHASGATDEGFCVIEWWNSEAEWDTFLSSRLQPAFEKVGDVPQPQVTRFPVHTSYPA